MNKKHTIPVLAILGVYLALFHRAPWPLNHELWLGTMHNVHTAIGVVLLAAAGYLWYKGRK